MLQVSARGPRLDFEGLMYNLKSLAFLADEGVGRDSIIVEKYFIGVDTAPTHLSDFLEFQTGSCFVKVDEKE